MPTVQQLMDFMSNSNHVGRRNAILARNLAIHFGISDGGVEVEMRNVIREAISQNSLIGSHSRGFYLINDLEEINRNLNSLQNRAEQILLRRNHIRRNWNDVNQTNPTNLPDLEVTEI